MASANLMSNALHMANGSNRSAGIHGDDDGLLASGRVVPFQGLVQFIQMQINLASAAIDAHCPFSTEMLLILAPFFVGFVRVMWPLLRTALYDLRARHRRLVVRDIVSVSVPVYRANGLPSDRNAFLQNAIFMYLSKSVWTKKPIPAGEWRNKSSVLLLIDPFRSRVFERSDSPFSIGMNDSSSDDDGDLAFAGVSRGTKKLQRLLLVKLPVGGAWVNTQDELGIEMSYKRQRINIAKVVGVERTLSLRARGPGAAQRLETFTQRCLSHFISQIPNLSKSTRSYYELQPTKSSGLLGTAGGEDAKLLFKRYPLSDEKNLDTVFFPEKDQIMKFVDDFLFHRGRFAVEGFPYKLGFLLHGPPGSGKTTFVKALAAYTGRHIVSVPLHAVQTNQQLYDVFLNRTFSCVGESEDQTIQLDDVIFLLDDVDASSPLVCARQRRRAVRRRKPAVLTAREQTAEELERRRRRHAAKSHGAAKEIDDEEELEPVQSDDDDDNFEEHIVELHEMKGAGSASGLGGLSADGLDTLINALRVGAAGADAGAAAGVGGGGPAGSKAASSQNLMGLGGGDGATSATAVGPGGKLTAFASGVGAGGVGSGFNGKKSLFSLFESADKLDLSGLLNVLDGVVDTPGRIVVMITNHPERLDPALVRPGRMSTRLRLDYIQFDALAQMAGLHFGDVVPPPDSQDVVRIAEKLEAEIAKDRQAVRAAARYRDQQSKAEEDLAAELADDDDVNAVTSHAKQAGADNNDAAAKETTAVTATAEVKHDNLSEKPIVIPSGVAAARVPRRTLTPQQISKLRACIAALEAEAEAWKRANPDVAASPTAPSSSGGTKAASKAATAAAAAGGEDPHGSGSSNGSKSNREAEADAQAASGPQTTDNAAPRVCPYTFHITPSEVEMMCAQTDSLEEFMGMLSQVIRGELKL